MVGSLDIVKPSMPITQDDLVLSTKAMHACCGFQFEVGCPLYVPRDSYPTAGADCSSALGS